MSNRAGPTLADRSAAARGRRTRRHHCWVHAPDATSAPRPGLVIEWRRTPAGWHARVVYVLGEDDLATTVESWVDADRLSPA